jgi:hypothetical protein
MAVQVPHPQRKKFQKSLNMQIKHIVKIPTFVPDPAVASSCNSLANHSTKKYATTHWRRIGVPKGLMDYKACWKSKRIQES